MSMGRAGALVVTAVLLVGASCGRGDDDRGSESGEVSTTAPATVEGPAEVAASIPIEAGVERVADGGGGSVWAAGFGSSVFRIDAERNEVAATIDLGEVEVEGLTADEDAAWVLTARYEDPSSDFPDESFLVRIDAATNEAGEPIPLGDPGSFGWAPVSIATGAGVTVIGTDDTLGVIRFVATYDATTGEELQVRTDAGFSPQSLAVADGAVWAVEAGGVSQVLRLDPSTLETVGTVVFDPGVDTEIVADGEDVWITAGYDGVARIDPARDEVVATYAVWEFVDELALEGGDVWLTGSPGDQVVRVDGTSGEVLETVPVPQGSDLAATDGVIWVAADSALVRIDPGSTG